MSRDITLKEAIDQLRRDVEAGARCPCCTQYAKVYRRKINSGMARSLIVMTRASLSGDWLHVPTVVGGQSREEGKLAYWGLVEEETVIRPDGGRAGWWRVTDLGFRFVAHGIALPKYARVYDGRCLGLDPSETATIRDALGTKFVFEDLMLGL